MELSHSWQSKGRGHGHCSGSPGSSPVWKLHPGKSWLRESWKELEGLLLHWKGSGAVCNKIPVNWSSWCVHWWCAGELSGASTQVPDSHQFSLTVESAQIQSDSGVFPLPGCLCWQCWLCCCCPRAFPRDLSPLGSPGQQSPLPGQEGSALLQAQRQLLTPGGMSSSAEGPEQEGILDSL